MQGVRSDEFLRLLRDLSLAVRGDEFGTDGGIENILEYRREFALRPVCHVADQVADEGLRHRAVHPVHGHMVPVIRRPAEGEFGEVARADDEPARLVGDIHQDLRALSRLRVLVSDVRRLFALPDIAEMA